MSEVRNCQNRTGTGLSRPRLCRIDNGGETSPWGPAIDRAGSFGAT